MPETPHPGAAAPAVEMQGIVVQFGKVRILEGASLSAPSGEVHALLGENGAGKSSLMKALFGLYPRAAGEIRIGGRPAEIANPHDALAHGVAMIHQELPFARSLSVAQNVFLGRERRRGPFGFIDEDRQNAETAEMLRPFPAAIDPRTPLGRLSIAQQQIVAIAKAISTQAEVIVLDEATTALTEHETRALFGILEDLKRQGKTFIMITHKLDEVFRIADRVTVMRDGRTVAALPTEGAGPRDLVRHMVGREVTEIFPPRPAPPPRPPGATPLLEARRLSSRRLRAVSFEVHRGEVVGVAGLMGAGRTELFDALFGADPPTGGEILMEGRPARIGGPAEAIRRRIAYITEDRKANGLALLLGIRENVALPWLHRCTRLGLVRDAEVSRRAQPFIDKLDVRARATAHVGVLSGGNQQKVVLAKWLATGADLFLFDEPTRGIDVGAKLDVYALIHELAASGKAVMLVTSELPELTALSDRYLVLAGGRLVKTLSKAEGTPEAIIYYASQEAPAQAAV